MKKVLILSGSPRKNGNSDILCDELLRGARESGNDVTKSVFAKRKLHLALDAMLVQRVLAYKRTTWLISCKK